MQSFALPGVFSSTIGLVPVAFHLAGVQRPPHLASGHVTLDALRRTLFHESKIG